MNVEIGTEAAQLPENEYINGTFLAASYVKRTVDERTEQNSKALCYLYFSYSTCDGGWGGGGQ
jgi:hypothetical protein